MAHSAPTTRFRFWLWLIRAVGVIVPRRLRANWRQEWEAELRHREAMLAEWDRLDWGAKLDLLLRSASAFWDALWLQPKRWEDEMFQDMRYAARMLMKHPGFTLVAVITLALGIGVNTALFTVYNAFVLKPLPLKDPNSIANVTGYDRHGKRNHFFSYLDYVDYRDRNTMFAGLIAWNKFLAPFGDQAPNVGDSSVLFANLGYGHLVSGNYFSTLGAEMALGRSFTPEENRDPGAHPALVLSHICWTRQFNSDPDIVGKTVRLAGLRFTIIGVTAPGFIGVTADSPQFWAPLMMRDQLVGGATRGQWLTERNANSFALTGRLKPGVTLAQAQAEMNVIAEQLARAYPDPWRKASVGVRSGATFLQLDDQVKPLVPPLLTAVGLVLLIACVNVTNMLLARAAGRQREIAVRLALGASRSRLARQLLTESVLLAAMSGVAGLLLAVWAIRLIYPLVLAQLPVPPALLEQFALDLSPDYRVFAFALLASLLAGIAAGLAPALQSSRPNLSGALKNEGSTFGGRLSPSRLRNALVVTQIAVCLTLLIAASLLTRNMQKLQTVETGLVTKNVFTLDLSAQYASREPGQMNELYRQLAARLRALPGVKSVGRMRHAPFTGTQTTPITIAGQEQLAGHPLQASYNFVSAAYFQTLGLRITRGRGFTEQEAQANAPVVVISESTARRFWPNENPIGKHIGVGVAAQQGAAGATSNFPQYEIIGSTDDARQSVVWRPDDTFLYLPPPAAQANTGRAGDNLIVSADGDVRAVMRAARNETAALDPNLVALLRLVDDSLAAQMIPFKDIALLAGALGMLALLLASIGLYGVMSFIVSQRTREIGIRMALGAQRRDVITLFLLQGGKLITVGVIIGLAGGAMISSLLASALTDISQFDPPAFGVVVAFLTLVALSACYAPARRATKVDPMVTLRHE
jgi:macrolide transport system ATP-binding/permease protein